MKRVKGMRCTYEDHLQDYIIFGRVASSVLYLLWKF